MHVQWIIWTINAAATPLQKRVGLAAFFAYRLGRASACKYYGEVADGPAENEQNSGRVDASKVNALMPEITI